MNRKNIFLMDAAGAFTSLVVTAGILPLWSQILGLTPETLYGLALFPAGYLLYGLLCYFFAPINKNGPLLVLIALNSFYCLVPARWIFLDPQITNWGRALLALEILVITVVVAIEVTVLQRKIH